MDRVNVVRRVDLLEQLAAAAEFHPREIFPRLGSERHGGEELQRRHFTGPETRSRPAGIDRAGRHRVENLQGRNQGSGFEIFELNIAARDGVDLPRVSRIPRVPSRTQAWRGIEARPTSTAPAHDRDF